MASPAAFHGSGRSEYLHAAEIARALHDPTDDWEGFRDTLWSYLVRVFGLEDEEPWPLDVPNPAGMVSGDAATVAQWMRERMPADQSSTATP